MARVDVLRDIGGAIVGALRAWGEMVDDPRQVREVYALADFPADFPVLPAPSVVKLQAIDDLVRGAEASLEKIALVVDDVLEVLDGLEAVIAEALAQRGHENPGELAVEMLRRVFLVLLLVWARTTAPLLHWALQWLVLTDERLYESLGNRMTMDRWGALAVRGGRTGAAPFRLAVGTEEEALERTAYLALFLFGLWEGLSALGKWRDVFLPRLRVQLGTELVEVPADDPDIIATPNADRIASRALTLGFLGPGHAVARLFTLTGILVPRDHGGPAVLLVGDVAIGKTWTLDDAESWTVRVRGNSGGLGLLIPLADDAELEADAAATLGRIDVELAKDPRDADRFVIGDEKGTSLQLGRFGVRFQLGPDDIRGAVVAEEGLITIAPGDTFSWLRQFMASEPLKVEFKIGLSWGTKGGWRFEGAAGMEIFVPIQEKIGPLAFHYVDILAKYDQEAREARARIEATTGLSIGDKKFRMSLDRFGVALNPGIPDDRESAKSLFEVVWPRGIGIDVDTCGAKGGAFIYIDPERDRYFGGGELKAWLFDRWLRITVVGLTEKVERKPDEGTGDFWSTIILGTLEGFCVPLFAGIRWVGVGILYANDRTADLVALRAGVRDGTLDAVLFPKDVAAQAPQIVGQLGLFFPAKEGHHQIGAMFRFQAGVNKLVVVDLGLVFEYVSSDLQHIRLLGRGSVTLPKVSEGLLSINIDLFGDIDASTGNVTADLSLHHSKLAWSDLTGDGALILRWSDPEQCLFSLGGFHPQYRLDEGGLPALRPLQVDLVKSEHVSLVARAYVAIVPNGFQFGADAELWASAGGFSIIGDIGFDAVLHIDLSFEIDFRGGVALKRGSRKLASVTVNGRLTGPWRWSLSGTATLSVWLFSVSVPFLVPLGPPTASTIEGEDATMPLLAALSDPMNWTGAQESTSLVLRDDAGRSGPSPLLPSRSIVVRQGVVPLDVELERFGAGAPKGVRKFSITSIAIADAGSAAIVPVKDDFAPGQFFELDDDQVLSGPAFEAMTSGARLDGPELAVGVGLEADTSYETIVIDSANPRPRRSFRPPSAEVLAIGAETGAATTGGRGAFYGTVKTPIATVKPLAWVVVDDGLRALAGAAGSEGSYAEAKARLTAAAAAQPRLRGGLRIVASHEVTP